MVSKGSDVSVRAYRFVRIGIKLGVVLACVYLAKLGYDVLTAKIALFESNAAARAMFGLMITVMIGYAILLAVPFVPGVEIGIAILVLEGAPAAPFVYVATILGLLLAFCVGQYAPLPRLIRLCNDLGLTRIAVFLRQIERTPRQKRLDTMHDRLPKWLAPILCNYRYITLGLAINLPGNIVLGGGGGIMAAAGLSRLFQTRFVVITLIVATLPVPLSVWLMWPNLLG